jgi:flagellar biosynthesis/type III secretory pathway M-ring protein FliF/YscJ
MREGPEFVFWFIRWGTAVVVTIVAISVVLFWLLKRWSDRQAAAHGQAQKERAGAKRRP